MRSTIFLSLLALAACGTKTTDSDNGGDNGGDNGADNGGNGSDCGVTVTTSPSNGSTNAYYRGDIEFILSAADATATITTDIPGSQTTSSDGKRVIWQLSAPLSPNTQYSASLSYCGGTIDLAFTTSGIGAAVSPADQLVGKTYALDLAAANIVEPPGIGAVLSSYLTTQVLIGIDSVSGSDIQMLGALAIEDSNPPTQDMCSPSIDFPSADFSGNPFFSIGPQDTTFSIAGYDIEIQSLNITGSFEATGDYIDGATLEGTIDTRPLAPLLDDTGNEGAICDLAVNFGAACEACPSDGGMFCLTLVANQIYADGVPGSLVTVSQAEADACGS